MDDVVIGIETKDRDPDLGTLRKMKKDLIKSFEDNTGVQVDAVCSAMFSLSASMAVQLRLQSDKGRDVWHPRLVCKDLTVALRTRRREGNRSAGRNEFGGGRSHWPSPLSMCMSSFRSKPKAGAPWPKPLSGPGEAQEHL